MVFFGSSVYPDFMVGAFARHVRNGSVFFGHQFVRSETVMFEQASKGNPTKVNRFSRSVSSKLRPLALAQSVAEQTQIYSRAQKTELVLEPAQVLRTISLELAGRLARA